MPPAWSGGACGGRAQTRPFRYVDKGNLATIGRLRAVGQIKRLRLSGPVAWAGWLAVHLWYLTGLQNRLLVFIRWTVSFITRGRGARLITGQGTQAVRVPRPLAAAAAARTRARACR
jgi:NADH:ubiquinone reductase (H+-translocating)